MSPRLARKALWRDSLGKEWRANFYRIDHDMGETTWQWQEVHEENFHDYEKFGTIVFE